MIRSPEKKQVMLFFIIAALLLLFFGLNDATFWSDEGHYARLAQMFIQSPTDAIFSPEFSKSQFISVFGSFHPPFLATYISLFFLFFGSSILVGNLATILISFLGVVYTYLLTKELCEIKHPVILRYSGIFSILFLMTNITFIIIGTRILTDIPFAVFSLISIYYFIKSNNNDKFIYVSALFSIFAILIRSSGFIIIFALWLLNKEEENAKKFFFPTLLLFSLLWPLRNYMFSLDTPSRFFIWKFISRLSISLGQIYRTVGGFVLFISLIAFFDIIAKRKKYLFSLSLYGIFYLISVILFAPDLVPRYFFPIYPIIFIIVSLFFVEEIGKKVPLNILFIITLLLSMHALYQTYDLFNYRQSGYSDFIELKHLMANENIVNIASNNARQIGFVLDRKILHLPHALSYTYFFYNNITHIVLDPQETIYPTQLSCDIELVNKRVKEGVLEKEFYEQTKNHPCFLYKIPHKRISGESFRHLIVHRLDYKKINPTPQLLIEAQVAMNNNDLNTAKELYLEALRFTDNSTTIYTNLGTIALFEKDLDKAYLYLSKAIELNNSLFDAKYNLAIYYVYKHQLNKSKNILSSLEGNKEEQLKIQLLFAEIKKLEEQAQ